MGVTVAFTLAALTSALVRIYNSSMATDPQRVDRVVRVIRQSTGVVLTIANAFRGILDALAMVQRAMAPSGMGPRTAGAVSFPRED